MNRPEQQIHRSIVQFIRTAYPKLIVFHPANGGARSHVEGAILKGLGVLAGTPDLVIVMPGGRVGFMEVKAKAGRVEQSQRDFADKCNDLGAAWCVVRSIEDVQQTLREWLAAPTLPANRSDAEKVPA